jgi:hypothetical protein
MARRANTVALQWSSPPLELSAYRLAALSTVGREAPVIGQCDDHHSLDADDHAMPCQLPAERKVSRLVWRVLKSSYSDILTVL